MALTFDRTSIGIGETATATLTASWNGGPGTYLSWVGVHLRASGSFVQVSDVQPIHWNNPAFGYSGQPVASDADVLDVVGTQFSLIPPVDRSNPIVVTSFTVTGTTAGLLTYHAELYPGASGAVHITTFSGDPPVFWGVDRYISETLVVVPGPGAVAVVVVAGVGGLGRRRG
ncbi:MAG: hypothetical protein LAT64_01165 [Phycisphaerales bacterium]|nr:hypothetical protein [Planctomycetota bacterium]MCH8507372.1 hypothetical protein [Phycisphaerales bacterium]